MDQNETITKNFYFQARQVSQYENYRLPLYLKNELPENKSAKILDIGCGLGQMLARLRDDGYTELTGIDISNESINECKRIKLNVFKINDISDFVTETKFDFIIMSHVLEHLEKNKVISTLSFIKNNLLSENGKFLIMVPNAQSPTGSYWAYEDFTHNTMFTAGSMIYVLKSAGFTRIEFIDKDGLTANTGLKKIIKRFLLQTYKLMEKLLFVATGASFHRPSPKIYTWELKVLSS